MGDLLLILIVYPLMLWIISLIRLTTVITAAFIEWSAFISVFVHDIIWFNFRVLLFVIQFIIVILFVSRQASVHMLCQMAFYCIFIFRVELTQIALQGFMAIEKIWWLYLDLDALKGGSSDHSLNQTFHFSIHYICLWQSGWLRQYVVCLWFHKSDSFAALVITMVTFQFKLMIICCFLLRL